VAAAWLLGRRLRPTLDAATRMGQGDLTARAPEGPDDAIGRLGKALNQMASRLDRQQMELAEGRDQRERILRLQRVRQEFVANVSHELKTPLTLIRGFTETLLDGGLEDEAHRRLFVEKIERNAGRLERIVEDLLELARLEEPGAAPGQARVDLVSLARGTVEAFRDAAAARGLRVELEPAAGPIPVRGDAEMLDRALSNLVDNAVKYTRDGSVTVAVGREEERAWCEVRDTGPGIPEEHLPRVFERFYRVDRGRAREVGGTGLGLAIVRHVAELHGGGVSARSEMGRGATFRLELPAAGEPPASPEASVSE
jgi:two-component system, OmpR family, phosphate regulon sensor histidine kinase PhoR